MAFSDYNKAVEISPNYTLALFQRGVAYFNKGKTTDAISDFKKAIKLNPDYYS